jgi:hypothetical protein
VHYHPDIRHEVNRRHYAELLEQARLERMAALGDAAPELTSRMSRVRGALNAIQLRIESRTVKRAGLNPAS